MAAHLLTFHDSGHVHCMTEDAVDEWFRSLPAERKAALFEAELEGFDPFTEAVLEFAAHPELGRIGVTDRFREAYVVAPGAVPVLPSATEAAAPLGVQPGNPCRVDQDPAMRAAVTQLLQGDGVHAAGHRASVAPQSLPERESTRYKSNFAKQHKALFAEGEMAQVYECGGIAAHSSSYNLPSADDLDAASLEIEIAAKTSGGGL